MTGWLSLKAKLDLPPGEDTVLKKMLLDGDFEVAERALHHRENQADSG